MEAVDHVVAAKAVLSKAFADTSTIEVRTIMKMMDIDVIPARAKDFRGFAEAFAHGRGRQVAARMQWQRC